MPSGGNKNAKANSTRDIITLEQAQKLVAIPRNTRPRSRAKSTIITTYLKVARVKEHRDYKRTDDLTPPVGAS